MKRYIGLLAGLLTFVSANAQELFVYTEPASNMPAHSLGIRVSNYLIQEKILDATENRYQFLPELMWGVNKNLMIHVEGFFNDRSGSLKAEGAGIYAKYRFYSHDKVYRHFRMAGFARLARNNAYIHFEEIETNGNNTGYELGLIATQLLHRQAISAMASMERIYSNDVKRELPAWWPMQAFNYSLSTGRLIFPREYKNYRQVNCNLMLELLGQSLPGNGRYYIDIAPSLQLIVNSQTRIDIGYRTELGGTMHRMSTQSFLVRVEHLLFNVL